MPFRLPLSRSKYLYAWFKSIFLDDGYVRCLYNNFYSVNDKLYRSSHPLPFHFYRIRRLNIKSILNLRGDSTRQPSTAIQRVACQKHDINLHFLSISSRSAPAIDTINKAKHLFDTMTYPALVHCKSGADRAGIVITLYNFIYHPEMSIDQANQLKWYYGHFKFADTGLLDAFVEEWRTFHEAQPEVPFMDWVNQHYDPQDLTKRFRSKRLSSFIVNKILRRE